MTTVIEDGTFYDGEACLDLIRFLEHFDLITFFFSIELKSASQKKLERKIVYVAKGVVFIASLLYHHHKANTFSTSCSGVN